MPGLLPASVANLITRYSGYMLDGSRIGHFVAEGKIPHYTPRQIQDRIMIICSAAASAFVANLLRRSLVGNSDSFSTACVILLGIGVGGYYSHKYAMRDTLANRNALEQEITLLKEGINAFLKDENAEIPNSPFYQKVSQLILKIDNYELIEKGEVKAAGTLFKRRNAYNKMLQKLSDLTPDAKIKMHDVSSQLWPESDDDLLREFGLEMKNIKEEYKEYSLDADGLNALAK